MINNFDKMQLRGECGLFGLFFKSPSIIKECQGTLRQEFEVKHLGKCCLLAYSGFSRVMHNSFPIQSGITCPSKVPPKIPGFYYIN